MRSRVRTVPVLFVLASLLVVSPSMTAGPRASSSWNVIQTKLIPLRIAPPSGGGGGMRQISSFTAMNIDEAVSLLEKESKRRGFIGTETRAVTIKSEFQPPREEFFRRYGVELGLASGHEMRMLTKEPVADTQLPSFQHSRLGQFFKGYPVEDGYYIFQEKNGAVANAIGRIVKDEDLKKVDRTVQIKTSDEALDYVMADLAAKGIEKFAWEADDKEPKPKGELTIIRDPQAKPPQKGYRLVWRFPAVLTQKPYGSFSVAIDPKTGEAVQVDSRLAEADAELQGYTSFNGLQKFIGSDSGEGSGARYSLSSEKPVILSTKLRVLTDSNQGWTKDEPYADSNTIFTNENEKNVGVAVFWAAQKAAEYFEIFGWKGLDGRGEEAIHAYVFNDPLTFNTVSSFYDRGRKHFGFNGAQRQDPKTGVKWQPQVSLDIVGHEWTHGVSNYAAGQVQGYERDAIDEGLADVFGTLIEFYVKGDQGNWIFGEDSIPGGMRWLFGPIAHGYPEAYMGRNYVKEDDPSCFKTDPATGAMVRIPNCGTHQSGSIVGFWFYNLAEGAEGYVDEDPTKGAYQVEGIGRENAAKLAYRILTKKLGPTSDFSDFRIAAIEAAWDLFPNDEPKIASVINALESIGLGEGYDARAYDPPNGATVDRFWPAALKFGRLPNEDLWEVQVSEDPKFLKEGQSLQVAAPQGRLPPGKRNEMPSVKFDLKPNTVYYWRVCPQALVKVGRAIESCGNTQFFMTGLMAPTLTSPIPGSRVSPWPLEVAWGEALPGVVGYTLRVADGSYFAECQPGYKPSGGSVRTYTPAFGQPDTSHQPGQGKTYRLPKEQIKQPVNLEPGKKYHIWLQAVGPNDSWGNPILGDCVGGPDGISTETVDNVVKPKSPKENEELFPNKIGLAWWPVSGAVGYNVQLSSKLAASGLCGDSIDSWPNVQGTTKTIEVKKKEAGSYYWCAQAVGPPLYGEEGTAQKAAFSKGRPFKTLADTPPEWISPKSGDLIEYGGSVEFKWKAVPKAEKYRIRVLEDMGSSNIFGNVAIDEVVGPFTANQTPTFPGDKRATTFNSPYNLRGFCGEVRALREGSEGSPSSMNCYGLKPDKPNIWIPYGNPAKTFKSVEVPGPGFWTFQWECGHAPKGYWVTVRHRYAANYHEKFLPVPFDGPVAHKSGGPQKLAVDLRITNAPYDIEVYTLMMDGSKDPKFSDKATINVAPSAIDKAKGDAYNQEMQEKREEEERKAEEEKKKQEEEEKKKSSCTDLGETQVTSISPCNYHPWYPTNCVVTAPGGVMIHWNPVQGAEKYQVWVTSYFPFQQFTASGTSASISLPYSLIKNQFYPFTMNVFPINACGQPGTIQNYMGKGVVFYGTGQ